MADERRVGAAGAAVLYRLTGDERRVGAAGMAVLYRLVRTWGDIPDATKTWHQATSSPVVTTVYFRQAFTIGPGYISGGTLTWQADHTALAYLNGSYLGSFVASGSAVEPETLTIPRQKLRGGDNILAFKLTSEAGLRGMLEFKLEVS